MSIDLSDLSPPEGATQKKTRAGRGEASGQGKTCGRGQNGQKSRSGGNIPPHFEGGQMPIYRRLPKWGFHHEPAHKTVVVNLYQLDNRFDDGDSVDISTLKKMGLVGNSIKRVKILGEGQLEKSLDVKASAFSESAEEKIVNAGGSIEVV